MPRRYLALGDSMSIDKYTNVVGGGAARQFHRMLGPDWKIEDHTADGCCIHQVPVARGDVITLTIGGNDLILGEDIFLRDGPAQAAADHLTLLRQLRAANPGSAIIVGNIYEPEVALSPEQLALVRAMNSAIAQNVIVIGAQLADIHAAFLGRQPEFICMGIEPTLAGASRIAHLFLDSASSLVSR